jgi:hypothetical protein
MAPLRASRALLLACVLVSAASCSETVRPTTRVVPIAPPPTALVNGVAMYIALSNDAPAAGDRVVVTVRTRKGESAKGVGSFTLAVKYDGAGLTLVEQPVPGEGVVAFNPTSGQLMAAGASTTGFASGELFHFVLAVGNPDALKSLSLDVKEVVSTGFADHRSKLVVARDFVRDLVEDVIPTRP